VDEATVKNDQSTNAFSYVIRGSGVKHNKPLRFCLEISGDDICSDTQSMEDLMEVLKEAVAHCARQGRSDEHGKYD
jgi:hypothetical protein